MRRTATKLILGLTVLAACSSSGSPPSAPPAPEGPTPAPAWTQVSGDMLEPLPAAVTTTTNRFTSSIECAFCHATEAGTQTLKDAKGRDVSPYNTWKATMMGLSARDPYYLAVFRHELDAKPGAAAVLEATCTRCHAPMGSVERSFRGDTVHFDDLLSGNAKDQIVAREGVSCTLCHQIQPDALGTSKTFTGGFSIGPDRRIFGPHQDPFVVPMQNHVDYTPEYAPHVEKSALCATCHTVITRAVDDEGNPTGPEFPEQAAYLEWQASSFNDEAGDPGGKSCQACHMPAVDDDQQPISSPLALRPPSGLTVRTLKGRHLFMGGNALMLRLLSENVEWTGAKVTAADLARQSERDEAMLASAAHLSVTDLRREGAGVSLSVVIDNESGHKLPTGYPSRRVIVHVRATAPDGTVVFESGRVDEFGRIARRDGKQLDVPGTVLAHRDLVSSEDEVQVYEAVMGDAAGKPAFGLLDATRYLKDNRLVPRGFRADHPSAAMIKPVGVDGDASFGSSDRVAYRIAKLAPGAKIEVELVYQSIRPSELESLASAPNAAALRLFDMLKRSDKRATSMGKIEVTAP